jgi:regulator of RNase E activity RraA
MALLRHHITVAPLAEAALARWRSIPTSIISDELNRSATLDAGIRPIGEPKRRVAGPAFTVRSMAADNLAIHHAVSSVTSGAVLVIDAGGYERNAVWGGILHRAAQQRGVAAVIVDGCVRDSVELRESSLPCFARGVVPAGPHKGWGGEVNAVIAAGGCAVAPGDLVVADADGVVIIPVAKHMSLLAGCFARIEAEKRICERIDAGETTVEILQLQSPQK